KGIDRQRDQDRLKENQTTTKGKEPALPARQSSTNSIHHWFPKRQPPRITTNREAEIHKRHPPHRTAQDSRRL
ncbi:hypothetical protein A2U01_0099534, partial [Trifolium medium]|nr:hypothetical protein [Trifolium medium]